MQRTAHTFLLLALVGGAWSARQDSPAAEPAATLVTSVPVGTILAWWGDVHTIPAGFELCDGRFPQTPEALLKDPKPDLQGRYLKGAEQPAIFRPRSAPKGGRNTSSATTGAHKLTVAEVPHELGLTAQGADGLTDPGHWHALPSDVTFERIEKTDDDSGDEITVAVWPARTTEARTTVNTTGAQVNPPELTLKGQSAAHDHGLRSDVDNQPAFLEVLYIIRVK